MVCYGIFWSGQYSPWCMDIIPLLLCMSALQAGLQAGTKLGLGSHNLHTYHTIVALLSQYVNESIWSEFCTYLSGLPQLLCTATGIHCCEIRYSSNSKTRLNGKISGLDKNKHTGYSSTCTKGLRKFLNLLRLMQA